jgi:GntR family transcriptional regulator
MFEHMTQPLHARIADRLRVMVLAAPGSLLPGEVELAGRWKVSRATVRQAFATLVAEGLVERRKRVGTVARPLASRLDAWQGFRAELAARGITVVDQRAAFLKAVAPAAASAALGTPPARKLWCLERVHGDAQGPLVRFVSWFAPAVPIESGDDPHGELWVRLGGRGCRPALSHEELRAVAADAATAKALGCAAGDPVLERRRLVRDAAGTALEWNLGWYRSDRFPLTLELEAR